MALNSIRLGDAVVDKIVAANPAFEDSGEAFVDLVNDMRRYWRIIADEIIKEIRDNAEVSTTVSTTVSTNVTGTIVSNQFRNGAGTGTGTGTGSGGVS